METLLYIGKVSLYWVLFYLCYWLMLRKHTFFKWNRYYLLAALLAAFAFPFIIYPESAPRLPVVYEVSASAFTISQATEKSPGIDWMTVFWLVYSLGALAMAFRLGRQVLLLKKHLRSGDVIELDDCKVMITDANQVGSFSFFNWIIINQNDYEQHFDAIMRHEMAHASQRHSLDILLVEILKIAFWFHPVLWFYKRSLQEIHEYLADAQAPNREHYAHFLLSYALHAPVGSLANHFFKPSQIKNRIRMIYKSRTSKWMLGTYAIAAALIGSTALFIAGCERQEADKSAGQQAKVEADRSLANKPIFTVVEQQPEFPGGNEAMFKFLGDNIRYPEAAAKANTEGKVILSFVVTEDGETRDIKVLKSVGQGCDEEAIRVLSKFPKWEPGMQNGHKVNVQYHLPINFKLEEDKPSKSSAQKVEKEIPLIAETFEDRTELRAGEGSDARIQFRGSAEPSENQPLYILDGEVMEDGLSLNTIEANTIKSVSVFKGPEATKIYGSKGAQGVVSIITKAK